MRRGLPMISREAWPRTQRNPWLSGLSGSPRTPTRRPSSRSTSMPQRVGWQFIGHMVRTVRRPAVTLPILPAGRAARGEAPGGAIILFGIVIPARVGLAMEFSVALMLILLGVLNLTGTLGRITEALSAGRGGQGPDPLHSHVHTHDDYVHTHPHGHGEREHGH